MKKNILQHAALQMQQKIDFFHLKFYKSNFLAHRPPNDASGKIWPIPPPNSHNFKISPFSPRIDGKMRETKRIWSDPGRNFKEKKIYDFSTAFGRKSNETKSLIEPKSKFGEEKCNFSAKSYKSNAMRNINFDHFKLCNFFFTIDCHPFLG